MALLREDILACDGQVLAIDTETNGLHWWKDQMIGLGIHCPNANISGYADTCSFEERPIGNARTKQEWLGAMDYSKSKRGRQVKEEVVYQPMIMTAIPQPIRIRHFVSAVEKIARNPATVLIGHNLKFDLHMMGLKSWELPCKIMDTSVMVHLYDSRLLKSLAAAELEFLGTKSKRQHVKEADKRFGNKPWFWSAEVLADYCTNDCVVTYQLAELLHKVLKKRDLLGLFAAQMRYLRLLQKMERTGMKVSTPFCEAALVEFRANIKTFETNLFDTIGYTFNWRSSSQLSKAIYDDIGIEKPTNPFNDDDKFDAVNARAAKLYTESATSSGLLIREDHKLANVVLPLREAAKLEEYAQKYIDLQDSEGVIHASFNQAKTLTGRLSSSSPNLQNLPSEKRKTDLDAIVAGGAIRTGGYNLRQALVARPGHKMVSIDHKQQEMRMLAILSQEPVMLEAMRNREDIHLRVAIRVWGDCGSAINKVHRDWSKCISFGLIYGLGEESLQEYFDKMGVRAVANEVKEQYFAAFPGLKPWFEDVIRYVKDTGYVQYWSKRYWFADNPGEGYKGINALIQGGCADLISIAALRVDKVLTKQCWGSVLSIIHDEILLEVKREYLREAAPVLVRIMEVEDIFEIPFAADLEVGDSYGSLKEFELEREPSTLEWREYA